MGKDALVRTARAAGIAGVRALLVHARDDQFSRVAKRSSAQSTNKISVYFNGPDQANRIQHNLANIPVTSMNGHAANRKAQFNSLAPCVVSSRSSKTVCPPSLPPGDVRLVIVGGGATKADVEALEKCSPPGFGGLIAMRLAYI